MVEVMSKIDWQMIFNPWAVIRKLRSDLALAERDVNDMYRDLRDAERVAFHKAEAHFRMRTASLEAQNNRLLENMITLKAMEPLSFVIPTPQQRIRRVR